MTFASNFALIIFIGGGLLAGCVVLLVIGITAGKMSDEQDRRD
jgi:hypothetical protein